MVRCAVFREIDNLQSHFLDCREKGILKMESRLERIEIFKFIQLELRRPVDGVQWHSQAPNRLRVS